MSSGPQCTYKSGVTCLISRYNVSSLRTILGTNVDTDHLRLIEPSNSNNLLSFIFKILILLILIFVVVCSTRTVIVYEITKVRGRSDYGLWL